MIIERVALPGIGVCHTATTARRQRLGVVGHATGRRDLILYDPDDPDRTAHAVVLDAAEAGQVADLLAASVTVDHVADGRADRVNGIAVARLRVPVGSPYDTRALGDVDGVTVVAVIRDGRVIAEPDAGFHLRAGGCGSRPPGHPGDAGRCCGFGACPRYGVGISWRCC